MGNGFLKDSDDRLIIVDEVRPREITTKAFQRVRISLIAEVKRAEALFRECSEKPTQGCLASAVAQHLFRAFIGTTFLASSITRFAGGSRTLKGNTILGQGGSTRPTLGTAVDPGRPHADDRHLTAVGGFRFGLCGVHS